MVYVFLAEGFEEIEAITFVDVLRRANVDVKTVGVTGKEVTGSHGIKLTADILIDEVNRDDLQMIYLPGGMPGAKNLSENEKVSDIIKYAHENKKYIAAICAAPFILGKSGLLKGVSATCYPGFEKDLIGANITKSDYVFDQNILTGKGPGVALEFSLFAASLFIGKAAANRISGAMQFKYELQ
ncbi:MAG: DJ-1/PfpI family protein [Clostridiaceae bacterium]|nr:DJ-1/PfpI family protein [Clostridiaceae bacterium]